MPLPDWIIVNVPGLGRWLRRMGYQMAWTWADNSLDHVQGSGTNRFKGSALDNAEAFRNEHGELLGIPLPKDVFYDAEDLGHGLVICEGFVPVDAECLRTYLCSLGYQVVSIDVCPTEARDVHAVIGTALKAVKAESPLALEITGRLKVDLPGGLLDAKGDLDGRSTLPVSKAFTALGKRVVACRDELAAIREKVKARIMLATDHSVAPWAREDQWTVVRASVYNNYNRIKAWVPPGWAGDMAFNRPIRDVSELVDWIDWVRTDSFYGLASSERDTPLGRKGHDLVNNTNCLIDALDITPHVEPLRLTFLVNEHSFLPPIPVVNAGDVLTYLRSLRREFLTHIESATNQEVKPATEYTVGQVLELMGVSNPTLTRYAKEAGVKTPGRGKRNHRYSADEVRRILQAAIDNTSEGKMRRQCRRELAKL